MKRHGVTLLEILVVCALFSLVLTVVAEIMIKSYRAHVVTTTQTANYKDACIALSRISREVCTCNLWGTPALGSTINANNSTAIKVLSFQRNNAATGSSDHWPAAGTDLTGIAPPPLSGTNVTYWLDVPSGELRSLVPGGTYRVAARSVTSFTVSCGAGSVNGSGNGLSTVNVSLTVQGINQPLELICQPPLFGM